MKKTILVIALAGMSASTGGCTTVLDQGASSIIKTVAPRAEKRDDGTYVLPEFSAADDGTAFSTQSPQAVHQSLSRMVSSLNEKERLYFVRVVTSLGYYHGCKDNRGQRHYIKNPFRTNIPGACDMTVMYKDSQPLAQHILEKGRPDGERTRVVQKKTLVSGTPIGDPYVKGYSSNEAWSKWIAWSGHHLNGKTRDELMQEFLQRTKGVYGKYAR